MKTNLMQWMCICTLALVGAGLCGAQVGNQGALEGTVSDPSGAVVSDAQITATNSATATSYNAASDSNGLYIFPLLPVGTYDVTAAHAGFAKLTSKGVNITVGAHVNLALHMQLAGKSETIEVSAEPAVVETTRTQVSTTVGDRQIHELPVNGRNFIDFVLLTPGVTRDPRLGDLSFGGLRGTNNSLLIDGADSNNTFFGQAAGRTGSGRAPYQFSQDAVQEFQVNTNGYAAEIGRAGGSIINVVTKSGGNQYHGSGWWYFRDASMNAFDPIVKRTNGLRTPQVRNTLKPPYHFNQFGASVGGPVLKDKLFFFFLYDGQRNTQPNTVTYIPPNIPAPDPFQALALSYLAARSQSWQRTQNQDSYFVKMDWNITPKHRLSGQYNSQRFTGAGFENGGSTNAFEHTGASLVHSDNVQATVTSTLSDRVINVARFNYLHDFEPGQANSQNPELIARESGFGYGGNTILTAGRNFFSPRETTINRYQYGDAVTVIYGKHTLKMGVDIIHDRIFNNFPGVSNGSYTFDTLENMGRSLCNGMTPPPFACLPYTPNANLRYSQDFFGTGTAGPVTQPNLFDFAWYLQDEYKVLPNLTLNVGVRYDLDSYAEPRVANPAAAAIGFRTDDIPVDRNNFAPRFGFAWSPLHDSKLVVRGGYGLFFGRTPSILLSTNFSRNGLSTQNRAITGNSAANAALIPFYPNSICGATTAAGTGCPPPASLAGTPPVIMVAARNFVQPYVEQFSLGTEYEFIKDFSLTVSYLGVRGKHLQRVRDVNLFAPVPATVLLNGAPITFLRYPGATAAATTPLRPFPQFNRIESIESGASNKYDAMIVQVNKRFSHNFQFLASYTWSHGLDDLPDATAVVPNSGDDAKLNYSPLVPQLDHASGASDIRNRFVFSGIWDLNYAQNLPTAARLILQGWQISGILTAQGGQPLTVGISGFDLNNDSNTSSERAPFLGRNTFRLPTNVSFDPRITRTFNIYESFKLQIFGEAFNVFNRFNYYNARSAGFSTATGVASCGVATPAPQRCLLPINTGPNAFGVPLAIAGAPPVGRVLQIGARVTF